MTIATLISGCVGISIEELTELAERGDTESAYDLAEVGTDSVTTLCAGETSSESIELTVPSASGTYYFGACVDSGAGEFGTGNNCSTGAAGANSAESISLNVPSDAGTYYYGACVDSVSGESDTTNSCSDGVEVEVSDGGGGADSYCRDDDTIDPPGRCDIYETDAYFEVEASGRGVCMAGSRPAPRGG